MRSYGLSLLRGIAEGVVPVSGDTRLRFVARTFPGALPYELYRGGELVAQCESRQDAERACNRSAWHREHCGDVDSGGEHWYATWFSEDGGAYRIRYGREDWPEPRVVLVGELNPHQDRRAFDLYDEPERASGHRLRSLVLGVRRETYFRRFARHNLCVGKWSAPAARKRAEELSEEYPAETFVLLGKKVQEAFGFYDVSGYFGVVSGVTATKEERTVVLLPHPSGLCRVWNEPGAFALARRTLLEACPGLPLGEVTND